MPSPHPLLLLLLLAAYAVGFAVPRATGPFFTQVDNQTWVIGNDVWNLTQEATYGVKLYYRDHDCVGDAVGHYVSYNGAASNLNWTAAAVVANGTYNATYYIDVAFTALEGDLHWVIFAGLHGAYQYFVNAALPPGLGEVRSLWRLDNTTFTHGRTNIKDEPLPPLAAYLPENKVQDETWRRPNATTGSDDEYITKYDFSAFVRQQAAYGVYGAGGFGSWYIHPGKDYYNGNHLKQELTVHRESATGDAVLLNMFHGTHFTARSDDDIPVGKMWGPWLWYLNDGAAADADARAARELGEWPYPWLREPAYQARGAVTGTLVVGGRPAAHAAVFLGDNHPNKTSLDMGTGYYYTTYAGPDGSFSFEHVRAGASYGLQAWANGSSDLLADVTTTFLQNDVAVVAGETTALGTLDWAVNTNKTRLFQVGDFDRYAYGFAHGGAPYQHALVARCPADLTYTVGASATADWCFGQTYQGNWTIAFEIDDDAAFDNHNDATSTHNATLIVSLASYSTGTTARILANDVHVVGNLTSGAEALQNDPGLYRSATVAGEWRYLEFAFDAALLREGWNTITFEVTSNTTWRGFMWDSIILEW